MERRDFLRVLTAGAAATVVIGSRMGEAPVRRGAGRHGHARFWQDDCAACVQWVKDDVFPSEYGEASAATSLVTGDAAAS